MVLFGGKSPSSLKYRLYLHSSLTYRKGRKSKGRADGDFELPWTIQWNNAQGRKNRLMSNLL